MNSKMITCRDEISYTESVVSCPSERASHPPFPCLSPPVYLPGLRHPLSLSTTSILILALLSLPFPFLCKTYFLPNPYSCAQYYLLLSKTISTSRAVYDHPWLSLMLNCTEALTPFLPSLILLLLIVSP